MHQNINVIFLSNSKIISIYLFTHFQSPYNICNVLTFCRLFQTWYVRVHLSSDRYTPPPHIFPRCRRVSLRCDSFVNLLHRTTSSSDHTAFIIWPNSLRDIMHFQIYICFVISLTPLTLVGVVQHRSLFKLSLIEQPILKA